MVHEYTHGVSVRLVGGGSTGCMNEVQSGALSEGWSDIFPGSFYDTPQTFKSIYEGTGFARHLVNDLTYGELCEVYDLGAACQYHSDSLIWTGTLWDLRRSMRALNPAQGLEKFHRILLKGVANAPCHPSYLDARQALLDADAALYGAAHRTLIWNAFAARGMGAAATTTGSSDTAPVADYSVPAPDQCSAPAAPAGLAAAPDGSNRVRLTYSGAGARAVEAPS